MSDDRKDTGQANLRAATAALLIAHGSRSAAANREFESVAELVRRHGAHSIVEFAFLELVEPTVVQAADRCVAQGARRVLLLPYFLFAGLHGADDLERLRQELSRQHPETDFVLCEPLGVHPAIIDVVLARLATGDATG